MKRMLWALSTCLLLVGCNNLYDEHTSLGEAHIWASENAVAHTFAVDNTKAAYQLTVSLRHYSRLPIGKLPIEVIYSSPQGNEIARKYTFPIRDAEGNLLGEALGDLCDTDFVVEPAFTFEQAGQYTVAIRQDTGKRIGGIMTVGLRVAPVE